MKIKLKQNHVDIEQSGRKIRFCGRRNSLGGFCATASSMKWIYPRCDAQIPPSDEQRTEWVDAINDYFSDIEKRKNRVFFVDDEGLEIGSAIQLTGGGKEHIHVQRTDKGRTATFSGDIANDGFRAYASSMRWLLPRSDRQISVTEEERKEWVDAINAHYEGVANRVYFIDEMMDTKENNRVSKLDIAIQDCMTIGPPENWNFSPEFKRDKNIVEKYGKDILSEIKEIERFLGTIEPPRKTESLKSFCRRVSRAVKMQYPLLKDESVNVLANSVAYPYWK